MAFKQSPFERFSPRLFARQISGATAIEYALIAALIAVGLVGGMTQIAESYGDNMGCIKQAVLEEDATEFCSNRGAD